VGGGTGRATLRTEEYLADQRTVVPQRMGSGYHTEPRPKAPSAFREPDVLVCLGESHLRQAHQAIANVGRRHRGAVRELRDAHDAILTQLDLDSTDTSFIVGNTGVKAVEDSRCN